MLAKASLGLIGLSAISVSGVAFTRPEWLGINKKITWKPLSQDEGFSSTSDPYKSKFGSDFRNYLVGLDNSSESWWNDRFSRIEDPKPNQGKFNGVDSGYSGNKSLKSLCEEAYKLDETALKTDKNQLQTSEFLKEEVWKFCSLIEKLPKSVSDNSSSESNDYGSGKIGDTKKAELLSIKHPDNQDLWKLKNDEFFGKGVFKSVTAPSDAFFKALFDTKDSNTDKDVLKKRCEEAYKLTSTDPATSNNPKVDDVVKYCSLKSIK